MSIPLRPPVCARRALSPALLTLLGLLGLLGPSVALASGSGPGGSSGGAGLGTTPPSGAGGPMATPIGGPVSAQGNGFTLVANSVGTVHRTLSFSGSVSPADRGDVASIQRQTNAGGWQTVAQGVVAADGRFDAAWRPSTSGRVGFRAALTRPAPSPRASVTVPSSASPTLAVTIYVNAIATLYGPGFYGRRTACGFRLTRATIGVASRTLKCGTRVSIDFRGRSMTVPVIDRGPFANGATWDLTEATARALHDPGTETLGAAAL